MLRRVVLRDAVILQPVQERGLACIVQAEEQDLRVFVGETCAQRCR